MRNCLNDDFVYLLLGARVSTGPGSQPRGLHDLENWSPDEKDEKKLVEVVLGGQAPAGKGPREVMKLTKLTQGDDTV